MAIFDSTINWQAFIAGVDLTSLTFSTTKLEISSNVESLYVTGEWSFNASNTLIENGTFVIGKTISFIFTDNKNNTIERKLSILKIDAGPGLSGRTIPGLITLTLISPWYFYQSIRSKAYRGRVSDILKQMMIEEMTGYFNAYEINDSTDQSLIRYRTFMTPGKFIEDRLRSHMRGEDFCPTFIYTDDYNRFVATSFNTIKSKYKRIKAFDPGLKLTADDPDYDGTIFPNTVKILFDGENLWKNSNPGITYNYQMNDYRGVRENLEPNTSPLSKMTPMLVGLNKSGFAPISSSRSVLNANEFTRILMTDSNRVKSDTMTELLYEYGHDMLKGFEVFLGCSYVHSNILGRYIHLILNKNEMTVSEDLKMSLYSTSWLCSEVTLLIQGVRAQTLVKLTNTVLPLPYDNSAASYYRVQGTFPKATSAIQ